MSKNLRDLIDLEKVSKLLEGFNKSTGFVTAILDLEGNVLSQSGWRQICTQFHRVHPKTSERCTYSDTLLAGKIEKGEKYNAYTCLNGMTDVAVPIVINGQHVGNLFSGQFFLEEPDINFFKKQANRFGFDEKEYMKALSKVPVISEEKVKTVMDFLLQMTNLISELGVEKTVQLEQNKKLRESEKELQAANQQLQATEQQLRAANQQLDANNQQLRATEQQLIAINQDLKKEKIFSEKIVETANAIIVGLDKDHIIRIFNQGAENITGYNKDEVIGKDWFKIFFPKEMLDEMNKVWENAWGVKSHSYINPILAKSGEERIISWQTTGIYDSDDVSNHLVLSIGEDITERKQAEQKVKESEERYRALFEKEENAIFIFEPDTFILVDANPAMTKTYGYSYDELIGMNVLKLSAEREKSKTAANEAGKKGKVDVKLRWHKKKDGTVFPIELQVYQTELEGRTVGYAVARDITESKQTEEEVSKLSTAVTQSPSVIIITDTDGKLEYVNPQFTEITGYSREEVIGQNPRILKSGEHPVEMYKALWETISSGKTWRGEMHNKKKNGELFWEKASVSPIFDAEGNIIRYIKVAEDITKQKRNEQIQSIIHNISNAVITSHSPEDFLTLVKEELGKLIDTTNFFVALYDEKTDRISLPLHHDEKDRWDTYPAGKTLTNYVIKTGKPLLARKAMIEKLIQSGEVEQVGNLSKVWLGMPLKSENKITGIFAVQSYDNENAYDEADVKMLEIISHQISLSLERLKAEEDLKLAKEKAEESDRLKTAFLNNMSHEIRTPLNGILGFTDILRDSDLTSEEKDEYIEYIHKGGQRLMSTVNDIVEISKIEAGIVTTDKKETNLNNSLQDIIQFFEPEARKKGLKVELDHTLPKAQSTLITDKYKFEAILTNLVKNAIKYTDEGQINVGANIKDGWVEFYVKDTGIGVPKHRQEAIFNRFEQADIKDTRAFEGSGLGLAISKSYMEMLGGKIWLESEENKGSVFYFSLPVEKAKETQPAENFNEPTESSDHKDIEPPDIKLKVLVAEDDDDSFLYLTTILKKYNWNIIHTITGRQAIEKYRKQPDIDLVLMDIKLPDIDGYEATRRIKEINPDVPIIAQTAYAMEGDRQKALDAGCDEYISKPIKKSELQAMIQKYFAK